jgi:ribosomal protein S18 acetylase RimI-like enzyme
MSEISITLRRAEKSDQAALGRLGALLVAQHHDFDARRFIPAGEGMARGYGRFLVAELRKSDRLVLVAVVGGEVAGYAYAALEGMDWLSLRGPAGVIYDIIVDPDRRGQGVGRVLLDGMLAALAERGAPQVVLSTAAQNEGAQALFASAGFRRTMIEMTRG